MRAALALVWSHGGSSNGRTPDSDSGCLGSNPSPPANKINDLYDRHLRPVRSSYHQATKTERAGAEFERLIALVVGSFSSCTHSLCTMRTKA